MLVPVMYNRRAHTRKGSGLNEFYETRKVSFASGNLILEGLLGVPASPTGAALVLCHPHPLNGGNMKNYVVAAIARYAATRGTTTLRFNFRGVGASQGVHDGGRGEMDDVRAAVDHLATEYGFGELALAGYSFGARFGLEAVFGDDRVRKLVAVAPPVTMWDFGDAGREAKPKLIIRGSLDEYVRPQEFLPWYEALPEPKREVLLEGADHFFQGREEEVGAAAFEFLKN